MIDIVFWGFQRIKIKEQIARLETQYKTYEEKSLGDLAVEINYVKSGLNLKSVTTLYIYPK